MPIIAHSDIDRVEIDQMCDTFTHITLQPGEILANAGDQVEPAVYFVKTVNKSTGGYIQLSNKDGANTRNIGPSEGFGFGRETLILSNIDDGSMAAAYGKEHGLFSLDSEQAVLNAKHQLVNKSIVTAQSTVTAMGTGPVQLRKLSIHDLRPIIYDELRLGKDYRKNRSYKLDVTKNTLEKKRLLGQGTFGQVWLCREAKSDEPYALKIQYKRELIDQHQADGVIKEKHIMEKMNHPFVMGIVNSQADTSCLYIVMDLVQGGELANQMRNATRPNLSEKSAKFYAACMLEGLSYMHRRDYIYRDLKGENVMIDRDGYCVIIDLGFGT
jgi:serine/threonine protein kinase